MEGHFLLSTSAKSHHSGHCFLCCFFCTAHPPQSKAKVMHQQKLISPQKTLLWHQKGDLLGAHEKPRGLLDGQLHVKELIWVPGHCRGQIATCYVHSGLSANHGYPNPPNLMDTPAPCQLSNKAREPKHAVAPRNRHTHLGGVEPHLRAMNKIRDLCQVFFTHSGRESPPEPQPLSKEMDLPEGDPPKMLAFPVGLP